MAAGLDPVWWSERQDKHNKDHSLSKFSILHELLLVYTTALHSLSLHEQPTKWEWMRILRPIRFSNYGHPHPKMADSPLRKIRHLIFYIPFPFLFSLWRVDSLKVVIDAIEQK
jgi:hypothetical protein